MSINLSDPRLYTVRPFSKPARTDLKDVFRVYLSPSTLLLHKLRSGDFCVLLNPEGDDAAEERPMPATVWPAPERIQDNIIQTSKAFQEIHNLRLGDRVSIRPLSDPLAKVQTVQLSEIPLAGPEASYVYLDKHEKEHWAWLLDYPLARAEVLCPGMVLEEVVLKGQRRSFKVEKINSSPARESLYQFVSSSSVLFQDRASSPGGGTAEVQSLNITQDGFGGLNRQLDILNQRLAAYTDGPRRFKLPSYYRPRRGGILLHGPSGTGKTMILHKVSQAGWTQVFHVDVESIARYGGNVNSAVSRIFAEARRRQPSVIIIDRLEVLGSKLRDFTTAGFVSIAPTLVEEFGRLDGDRILVLAATTNLSSVEESLRRPECFGHEIEIPVPDSKARGEILKILSGVQKRASVPMLERLGDQTHGFVGADLGKIVQIAVDKAKARAELTYNRTEAHGQDCGSDGSVTLVSTTITPKDEEISIAVEEIDLQNAFQEVRPTAMQEVFLETPKVRWVDIGGQHEVKKSLRQAVEWPLKYAKDMVRLGIEPKKGLLLYGPPGCSKTLTAKAVATEAGLNFIAVKGAELLSMYVGESERAIREIFRKARAASPSIIFFDEIDAIGTSREGPGQHGGLNVLTTLLNELDGIEVLKGVFVLAATNKPEVLDPALMRPGRLDTILYIGLPDLEARLEILQIRLGRMDTGEDVDIHWLAQHSDGYSGAELVSICQRAGYAALDEQEGSGKEMQVCMKHLVTALGETHRQITEDMKTRYERWGRRDDR